MVHLLELGALMGALGWMSMAHCHLVAATFLCNGKEQLTKSTLIFPSFCTWPWSWQIWDTLYKCLEYKIGEFKRKCMFLEEVY